MKKTLLLLISHAVVLFIGFAAGVYLLPILTAPPAPSASEVAAATQNAQYTGEFRRDLEDSDALHWGEGTIRVDRDAISHEGKISPGPDYKLYLSPEYLETEADFARLKSAMARVGDVKTFENFIVSVPESIDPDTFNTVVIWCETFGQFVTSARYR